MEFVKILDQVSAVSDHEFIKRINYKYYIIAGSDCEVAYFN